MERFAKLFGSLIVFVYHCFDRVVIHGYLSGRAIAFENWSEPESPRIEVATSVESCNA